MTATPQRGFPEEEFASRCAAAQAATASERRRTWRITGSGLTWDAARPTLAGKGEVKLANLRLPEQSVVGQLAALAGGDGDRLPPDQAIDDTG